MNTTQSSLAATGWKLLPSGLWQSPLTGRAYPERTARLLAELPPGVKLASQMRSRQRQRTAKP